MSLGSVVELWDQVTKAAVVTSDSSLLQLWSVSQGIMSSLGEEMQRQWPDGGVAPYAKVAAYIAAGMGLIILARGNHNQQQQQEEEVEELQEVDGEKEESVQRSYMSKNMPAAAGVGFRQGAGDAGAGSLGKGGGNGSSMSNGHSKVGLWGPTPGKVSEMKQMTGAGSGSHIVAGAGGGNRTISQQIREGTIKTQPASSWGRGQRGTHKAAAAAAKNGEKGQNQAAAAAAGKAVGAGGAARREGAVHGDPVMRALHQPLAQNPSAQAPAAAANAPAPSLGTGRKAGKAIRGTRSGPSGGSTAATSATRDMVLGGEESESKSSSRGQKVMGLRAAGTVSIKKSVATSGSSSVQLLLEEEEERQLQEHVERERMQVRGAEGTDPVTIKVLTRTS